MVLLSPSLLWSSVCSTESPCPFLFLVPSLLFGSALLIYLYCLLFLCCCIASVHQRAGKGLISRAPEVFSLSVAVGSPKSCNLTSLPGVSFKGNQTVVWQPTVRKKDGMATSLGLSSVGVGSFYLFGGTGFYLRFNSDFCPPYMAGV